jgi:mono/diheme cytochrome c family protein
MKRVLILAVQLGLAQSLAIAAPVDFVRDVRPILQKHCYSCHGATKKKSGLRLDIKSEVFKGGDAYGPSVVAKNVTDSPLIQLVTSADKDSRMPPKGESLSPAEIAALKRWIEEGAVWPDGVDLATLEDKRDHWSFHPVTQPVIPAVRDKTWPRNDVDRFVLARLEREGLTPSPQADEVAWLRRVTLDLTGLPPTPEDVAAFLKDVDGTGAVVDRLLKSPRYGERWAQHWLDVVRYADTHGFEVNTERPNAWPYRDYVIGAFNNDTPYDRFIREQVVGDVLGQDAATGFLLTASVLLPGQIGADEPSKRLARQDSLDEIIVNIGQTFLGLSVGCARCHDHKFDPISQRDYYAMQAFVAGVEYADRELRTPEAEARRRETQRLKEELAKLDQQLARLTPRARSGVTRPPVNARLNSDRFTTEKVKRLRFTIQSTNNLEPCIDELEVFDNNARNIALASHGAKVISSGDTTAADRHELRFINDGRYGNSKSWMSSEMGKGWVVLEFPEEQVIERVVWGRDREGNFADRLATDYRIEVARAGGDWQTVADSSDRAKFVPGVNPSVRFSTVGLKPDEAKAAELLLAQKQATETKLAAASTTLSAFAGTFRTPDVIHLLNRGDPEQPKDEIQPAVLSSFGSISLPKGAAEQQRRTALADWIAGPKNPFAARVMVNRIWQGHFGVGLVETASDFGRTGTKPSHPELLDWLAQEFMRSGWSIKHMHRLIVLSATYRQSTKHNAVSAAKDVDARLLWRYPSRRMDAEVIRDSMLAISGRLNRKMGGRGFDLFNQRGGLSGFTPIESFSGDGLRRMIYAHKVRRERDVVFGAFDCPDGGQSISRRLASTTPIQAMNLFNSRFTIEQAAAFAARVRADVGDDVVRQIRRTYQIALSVDPKNEEIADAESIVREHGLETLCRVLFNSNAFLFLP